MKKTEKIKAESMSQTIKATGLTLLLAAIAPTAFAATLLANSVTVSDISGDNGSEQYFTFEVETGASNLNFVTEGGSGDADLYVKFASEPTTSLYDCRPYKNGNVEKCEIEAAGAGVYHIMLRGYLEYSGVSLKVKVESEQIEAGPCADCEVEEGTLTGSADSAYHPDGTYYQRTTSGNHQIWMVGPNDADFDIYLMKWDGKAWKSVARSTKSSSEEQINYFGEAGYYTVKVDSYSGVGDYKVYLKQVPYFLA